MVKTTFDKIQPAQVFRIVGTQYAVIREYSQTGLWDDFDLDSNDEVVLIDHGDADGPFVRVVREGWVLEGALRLDAWAEVELVLPSTGLEFTYGACDKNHLHRVAVGYTICDDTQTYWA